LGCPDAGKINDNVSFELTGYKHILGR
jgi:hypothetical protein